VAEAGAIKAGRAFVEIFADDRKLAHGLKGARARLAAFGSAVRAMGQTMFIAGSAILAPLLASVHKFTDFGDSLAKMSKRTGVSVEALSELDLAVNLSGAEMGDLETGLKRMQKAITAAANGGAAAQEALRSVGLEAADLAGLAPEDQIAKIADGLAGIQDSGAKAAAAMAIFGRSGTKLIPLLNGGAAGIAALRQEARDLGLTMSAETVAGAERLEDAFTRLRKTMRQIALNVGAALAPMFEGLADSFKRGAVAAAKWVKEHQGVVQTTLLLGGGIASAGAALISIGIAIQLAAASFRLFAPVILVVKAALSLIGPLLVALLSPIGLIVAGLAFMGAAILVQTGVAGKAVSWLGQQFQTLRSGVAEVIGGIIDALAAGDVGLAAEVLWGGIRVAWESGIAPLEKLWSSFTATFQHLANEAFTGMQTAWIIARDFLEESFPKTMQKLEHWWNAFAAGIKTLWADAQDWIQGQAQNLMISDPGQQAEAQKMLDEQHAQRLSDIEDEKKAADKATDARVAMSPADRAAQQADELAKLERERNQRNAQIDQEHAASISAAQDALDKARSKLTSARETAAEARQNAEIDRQLDEFFAPGPGNGGAADAFLKGLDDVADRLRGAIESRGTFQKSVGALLGLQASSNPNQRIAKATEQTAKNTGDILDAMEEGGATFE